jgi:hypothetical protein
MKVQLFYWGHAQVISGIKPPEPDGTVRNVPTAPRQHGPCNFSSRQFVLPLLALRRPQQKHPGPST